MWESRPVEIVLQLPEELADDVERLRQSDPEFLRKVIHYGLTRRAMFQELDRSFRSTASEPRAQA